MASFRTHLTFSTVLGAGYGGAAYVLFDVPVPTCVLAGGLCSVSGMLPDVDSNAGVPLRESMAFAAAVVPMMLMDRFRQLGLSPESMILAGAGIYLFIRFVVAGWLRRYTTHRGMFHSLPAAVIVGELAFLLSSGDDLRLRIYGAGAVFLGYVSHLVLDELSSFQWHRGRLRLKRSFGSALKLFCRKWWPNVSTYLKLAVLTYVVLKEPGWMQQHYRERIVPTIRNQVGAKPQAAFHSPLPTLHYPLSTTHYPLPTTHYPLPTTHCPLPRVHHQRHRPVVDQFDFHVLAEPAGGHFDSFCPHGVDEDLVESFRHLGRRGGDKTWAAAFSAIAQEGKLTDHQHRPADVADRKVHLSLFILEDPQSGGLPGQRLSLGLGIAVGHAQEDQEAVSDPATDLFVHGDLRATDSLNTCSHRRKPLLRETLVRIM